MPRGPKGAKSTADGGWPAAMVSHDTVLSVGTGMLVPVPAQMAPAVGKEGAVKSLVPGVGRLVATAGITKEATASEELTRVLHGSWLIDLMLIERLQIRVCRCNGRRPPVAAKDGCTTGGRLSGLLAAYVPYHETEVQAGVTPYRDSCVTGLQL